MKKEIRKIVVTFALFNFPTYSYAILGLEGEYLCNSCHGYLTVKAAKPNTYKVWLGVGGGSCGSLDYAKSDAARSVGNTFS